MLDWKQIIRYMKKNITNLLEARNLKLDREHFYHKIIFYKVGINFKTKHGE